MKSNAILEALGGRKNMLGYLFLICGTYLVRAMLHSAAPPDYIGMSTVIGALAVGLGTIVWGNVKEHESKSIPANKATPEATQ